MATKWEDMKVEFQRATSGRTFQPCAHYDQDADAITFFFSNEAEYRQRLNSRVTIYLSDETNELVGCRIKGVRSVLEDIGSFDVSISHGKIKLKMLFVALHAAFDTDVDARSIFRVIGRAVAESDVELDIPECV